MWMQLLMVTPYLAIVSSFVLAVTIAAVCLGQTDPRAAGFEADVGTDDGVALPA